MKRKTLFLSLTYIFISLLLIFNLSSCGETDEQHNHSWGEWQTTKDATCAAEGEQERVCECGEKETKQLSVLPHTEVADDAVAPTCTTDGKTEGKHCSVCNEVILKAETIPASHTFTDTVVPPTTKEDGYTTHTCSVCGYSFTDSTVPAAGSAGLEIKINADKKSCRLISLGKCTDTTVYIPAEYEGIPVTSIEAQAFYYGANPPAITEIVVPDTVTSIGDHAFAYCVYLRKIKLSSNLKTLGLEAFVGCASLESIDIPGSLTKLRSGTFMDCSSLKSVNISDSVAEIETYRLFYNCISLESFTVPKGMTDMTEGLFENCISLKTVVLHDNVKKVGGFKNCTSLVSIDIPNTVQEIDYSAFQDCTSLKEIFIPDNIVRIYTGTFSGCTSLENVTGAQKLLEIWEYAFYNCTSLKKIDNLESVNSIKEQAFAKCSSLTDIKLSKNIYSIGTGVFYGCTGLTSITMEAPNNDYRIENGCLIDVDLNSVIVGFANGNIPEGIKKIAYGAFSGRTTLKSVVIPESVTVIDSYAFENCTGIESISLPQTELEIKENAFYGCSSLKSLVIPDGIKKIAQRAFAYCTSLETVYIGKGYGDTYSYSQPTNIFSGCINLKTLVVHEQNPAFRSENNCLIVRETDTLITACITSVIPESVKVIGSFAFEGLTTLERIVIASHVKNIQPNAFLDCTGLKEVILPDGIDTISSQTFWNCTSLTTVYIPASVTTIEPFSFNGCISVENVVIDPENQTYRYKEGCIINKQSETSVICFTPKVADGVINIGRSSFANAELMTFVIIPTSVKSVEMNAFWDCENLVAILYEGTIEEFYKISINNTNEEFLGAYLFIYSETKPASVGQYWHYVNGVPMIWQ